VVGMPGLAQGVHLILFPEKNRPAIATGQCSVSATLNPKLHLPAK
jgi:hypothetical protein